MHKTDGGLRETEEQVKVRMAAKRLEMIQVQKEQLEQVQVSFSRLILKRKIDEAQMKRVQALSEEEVEIEANVKAIEQKKLKDRKAKIEIMKA